jgi:hypothetical protein
VSAGALRPMNSNPNGISRLENIPRVVVCRLLSLAAILSLWHVADWAAAAIYGAGALVYYIPQPAAALCPAPVWLRPAWFAVAAVIAAFYFLAAWAAPSGSVVPPEFKYGMLALLAVQVAFDVYRWKRSVSQASSRATASR